MSKYVCGKRLEESVNSFCSGCRAMSFCLPSTLWNFPLFSVMIIVSVKILDDKQQKLTPTSLSRKGFIVKILGSSQHL